MFHITASSSSLFVYCTRCTGDDLQLVCIGTHNDSYRHNSKGEVDHSISGQGHEFIIYTMLLL